MQGSFNGTLQIVSQADIQTPSKGPRWLGQATANRIALITPISVARWLLVLIAAGVAVFFTSAQGKELFAYGQDALKELRKVVWPTRPEATQMTLYVFAFVVVMALFLWLTDKTLEWVFYDLILGWRN